MTDYYDDRGSPPPAKDALFARDRRGRPLVLVHRDIPSKQGHTTVTSECWCGPIALRGEEATDDDA